MGACGLHADNYSYLVQKCEQCVNVLGEAVRFSASGGGNFNLQKISDALRLAYDPGRPPSEYRMCVQELPDRGHGKDYNGGGKHGGGGAFYIWLRKKR